MRILCTICARGGSKGVKLKNIRALLDKPLIAWTIEQALDWGRADKVVVSTDNEDIAQAAREFGADVPFARPAELASDTAAKIPVIKHAVSFVEERENFAYDFIVDLDPTSPLRNLNDIEQSLQMLIGDEQANNVYSVCRARKSPYFNMVETDESGYARLSKQLDSAVIRRQDAPAVYEMNASIYIYRRDFLLDTDSVHSAKTMIYEMPFERSVDIDSEIDFKLVELLMKEKILNGEK